FNEPIYICDYLEDGLTRSIRKYHRNSPKGTMLFYNEMIRQKRNGLKKRLIAAVNYWRYTIKYKGERAGELAPIGWSYCCYPLGLLFYYMDIRKK
ncbi:glycosyltransferase family 2 protein, partial [Bacteroides faecis]|nr:glycosyltransferase family 2 protein [Bacteroides faecis]